MSQELLTIIPSSQIGLKRNDGSMQELSLYSDPNLGAGITSIVQVQPDTAKWIDTNTPKWGMQGGKLTEKLRREQTAKHIGLPEELIGSSTEIKSTKDPGGKNYAVIQINPELINLFTAEIKSTEALPHPSNEPVTGKEIKSRHQMIGKITGILRGLIPLTILGSQGMATFPASANPPAEISETIETGRYLQPNQSNRNILDRLNGTVLREKHQGSLEIETPNVTISTYNPVDNSGFEGEGNPNKAASVPDDWKDEGDGATGLNLLAKGSGLNGSDAAYFPNNGKTYSLTQQLTSENFGRAINAIAKDQSIKLSGKYQVPQYVGNASMLEFQLKDKDGNRLVLGTLQPSGASVSSDVGYYDTFTINLSPTITQWIQDRIQGGVKFVIKRLSDPQANSVLLDDLKFLVPVKMVDYTIAPCAVDLTASRENGIPCKPDQGGVLWQYDPPDTGEGLSTCTPGLCTIRVYDNSHITGEAHIPTLPSYTYARFGFTAKSESSSASASENSVKLTPPDKIQDSDFRTFIPFTSKSDSDSIPKPSDTSPNLNFRTFIPFTSKAIVACAGNTCFNSGNQVREYIEAHAASTIMIENDGPGSHNLPLYIFPKANLSSQQEELGNFYMIEMTGDEHFKIPLPTFIGIRALPGITHVSPEFIQLTYSGLPTLFVPNAQIFGSLVDKIQYELYGEPIPSGEKILYTRLPNPSAKTLYSLSHVMQILKDLDPFPAGLPRNLNIDINGETVPVVASVVAGATGLYLMGVTAGNTSFAPMGSSFIMINGQLYLTYGDSIQN